MDVFSCVVGERPFIPAPFSMTCGVRVVGQNVSVDRFCSSLVWVDLSDVGFDCQSAHETGKGQGGPTMCLAWLCYLQ